MADTGSCTVSGIVGATALILVTTLDDCVWLVPFLACREVVLPHAALFGLTLLALTTIVGYSTLFLQHYSIAWYPTNERVAKILWSCCGAVLCWIFAAFFFWKSIIKRRKRNASRRATSQEEAVNETSALVSEESPSTSINADAMLTTSDSPMAGEMRTVQPWTVIMLTTTGFLDEVSYFPALILGRVFTVPELIVATLCTVAIMLLIVTQCLSKCRPLLHCLDRIPLYGVITLFAILLTIDAVLDITTDE